MFADSDPALGTAAVARVLQVAPRTVSKLIDSRRMPGYKIPGSKTRRVLRSDLVAFCRRENLPESMIALAEAAVCERVKRPRETGGTEGRYGEL